MGVPRTGTGTSRAIRTIAISVTLALASTAVAQPADTKKQAQALYQKGTQHYALHEYAEAITAFKDAYRLMNAPLFLYNIAQAYRLAGDCVNATTFYKDYLRDAPADPDRLKIEQWIAELQPCVTAAGKPAEKPLGEVVTLPPEPAEPPPEGTNKLRIAGLVTLGGAAVLTGVGIVFSVRASHAADDLEAACKLGCQASDVVDIDDRGKSSERTATILYFVGGAALAVGGSLLVYSAVTGRSEQVAITPTRGGAFASVAFGF